jgi:hypothetical protein
MKMENINSLNSIINKKGKEFTFNNFKSNETIRKKERLTRSLENEELKIISEIQQKKIKKNKSKRRADHNDDENELNDKRINKNLNQHNTKRLKLTENTKNNDSLSETERNDAYNCMCVKLNELFRTQSIPKFCLNTLIGSPIYIQFISTALFLGLISSITTLYILSIPVAQINNSYFANCSSNSDCNSSKGLHCSAQDGICSCPAYKTKGRCDCSKGYYWNGYECRRLYQYLETGCTADWMCDSYKTKYIYCINRTC